MTSENPIYMETQTRSLINGLSPPSNMFEVNNNLIEDDNLSILPVTEDDGISHLLRLEDDVIGFSSPETNQSCSSLDSLANDDYYSPVDYSSVHIYLDSEEAHKRSLPSGSVTLDDISNSETGSHAMVSINSQELFEDINANSVNLVYEEDTLQHQIHRTVVSRSSATGRIYFVDKPVQAKSILDMMRLGLQSIYNNFENDIMRQFKILCRRDESFKTCEARRLSRQLFGPSSSSSRRLELYKHQKKSTKKSSISVKSPKLPTKGERTTEARILKGSGKLIPAPEELFKHVSGNWTRETKKRLAGRSRGSTDKYWFSPQQNYKFRSLKGVKEFLFYLQQCDGDEQNAYVMMKGTVSL